MSKQIDKSFNDTIASESIGTIKDYVELGLDAILSEGLLRDVPIMGTLVSIFKIGSTLRDRHTFKKIAVFLNRLTDIPLEEREKFATQMTVDDAFGESISEKILLMLDRLDETQKAEIIGNLFKAYVLKLLTRDEFFKLVSIVERGALRDLLCFHFSNSLYGGIRTRDHVREYSANKATLDSLRGLGLYSQTVTFKQARYDIKPTKEPKLEYKINEIGRKLADYMYYDLANPKFTEHITEVNARAANG